MRFRMFRELKLMVLGLFSGLRALGENEGFRHAVSDGTQ